MKPMDHPDTSRRRIALAGAGLLVAALVLCPAARVYAAEGASPSQASTHSWLTQATALWTDLWTAASRLFPVNIGTAATTDGTTVTATSDPPSDTTGDGGFDPGGDGGFLDPNGGFGT